MISSNQFYAEHEVLNDVGSFLIIVLVLAVEEAPRSVAAFLSNLQNDVELCVTFIFTEFNT